MSVMDRVMCMGVAFAKLALCALLPAVRRVWLHTLPRILTRTLSRTLPRTLCSGRVSVVGVPAPETATSTGRTARRALAGATPDGHVGGGVAMGRGMCARSGGVRLRPNLATAGTGQAA